MAVVITNRDVIRDASGDYGCPSCWRTHQTRLRPTVAECPQCHAMLYWDLPWTYTPQPVTPERRAEIVALAEGIKDEAAHDIEDKRDLYTALIDLLDVAGPSICAEDVELRRV